MEQPQPQPQPQPPLPTEPNANMDIDRSDAKSGGRDIVLKLGDVIRLNAPRDETVHGHTFLIDYIDDKKMRLLDIDSGNAKTYSISETGKIGDGSIQSIDLLSSNPEAGFARQNGLVTGKWVNLYFGGDIPFILVGEVTDLEEDMIELRTVEGDTLYIDFKYRGIPEDLPIEAIEIRSSPPPSSANAAAATANAPDADADMVGMNAPTPAPTTAMAMGDVDIPEDEEERIVSAMATVAPTVVPAAAVAAPIVPARSGMVIDLGDLEFGDEFKVEELVTVSRDRYRFSLESQTNDMLEELLALVPTARRTSAVLNRLHLFITRFVQLRELASVLDDNKNVVKMDRIDNSYKPLKEHLAQFGDPLHWVVPVVSQLKKMHYYRPPSQMRAMGADIYHELSDSEYANLYPDALSPNDDANVTGVQETANENVNTNETMEGEYEINENATLLNDNILASTGTVQNTNTYVQALISATEKYQTRGYDTTLQSSLLSVVQDMLRVLHSYSSPSISPLYQHKYIMEAEVRTGYPVMVDNSATGNLLSSAVSAMPNTAVRTMPFQTTRYTEGFRYLVADNLRGSAFKTHRANLTPNDTVAVRAMLFLPRQIQQYSKVTLPSTSILQRAICNELAFQQWKLFADDNELADKDIPVGENGNGDKIVSTIYLQQLDQDLKYDTEVFLERFVHVVLPTDFMKASSAISSTDARCLYLDYLRTIIPNSRFLVQCVLQALKKTRRHCLSYVKWMDELAPYQITMNTVTDEVGKQIASNLKTQIADFLNMMKTRTALFASLKHMRFATMRSNEDGHYLFSNRLMQMVKMPVEGATVKTSWQDMLAGLQKKADQYGRASGVSMQLEEVMSHYFANTTLFNETGTVYSPAEVVQRMSMMDGGNVFHAYVALTCLSLIVPNDLQKMLQADILKLSGMKELDKKAAKKSDCKPYTVAKKYRSFNVMKADNGKEVLFFDREYDKTPYDVLEERYGGMRSKLAGDQLKTYVKQDLQTKAKMSPTMAEEVADAFMLQAKRVREGHYALLVSYKGDADATQTAKGDNISVETIQYYVRNNNVWVQVPDGPAMEEGMAVDESALLCDLNMKCIFNETEKNDTAQCTTNELTADRLKEITLNAMLSQYDGKFQEKYEEVEKREFEAFLRYIGVFPRIQELRRKQEWKYATEKYTLGLSVEQDGKMKLAPTSPYAKLRDLILGQNDFVKRQSDIVRFANLYCREGNPELPNVHDGEMENKWWMYCKKTDVKLLPTFRYKLAYTFVTHRADYDAVMAELIKEIGKLGDEGDAWVDVNSGEVISYINFDTTEGFTENGFVDKSRDVLDKDAMDLLEERRASTESGVGVVVAGEGATTGVVVERRKEEMAKLAAMKKRMSPEGQMIYSVVSTVATNMGIQLDDKVDWIIKTVTDKLADTTVIETETAYKMREEAAARNGKKLPAYSLVYFTTLFYITLGTLLIAIQTSIPSIKTNKTFPGCVRSFVGFPLDGNGDASSLDYLACVVVKLRDGKTAPWNIVPKKAEDIASKTRIFLVKFLLPTTEIDHVIKTKIAYLMTAKEEDVIPAEHAVEKWSQFRPPLRRFRVEHVPVLSDSFSSMLQSNLSAGSPTQFKQIMSIQAAIEGHALAMQEAIQDIVDKKTMLLKAGMVPFVDNACCNEQESSEGDGTEAGTGGTDATTTLAYFARENANIRVHLAQMERLELMQRDLTSLSRATLFLSTVNTKRPMTQISKEWSEDTIYLGFIHFCKFQSALPLSEQLATVCVDKPDVMLRKTDSLQDRIARLRRENRNYTKEQFVRLFQIVCRENRVSMDFVYSQPSPIQEVRDTLAVMDSENVPTEQVPSTLRTHLSALLDTFEVSISEDTQQMRQMKNYLDMSNKNMRDRILAFVEEKRQGFAGFDMKWKSIKQGIKELMQWRSDNVPFRAGKDGSTISDDGLYGKLQFMRNCIQNIVNVYPSMFIATGTQEQTLGRQIAHGVSQRAWVPLRYQTAMKLSAYHENELYALYENEKTMYFDKMREVVSSPSGMSTLTAMLQMVMESNHYVQRLSQVTPVLSSFLVNNKEYYSVFEKTLVSQLYEYYFLMSLFAYVQQSEDIVGVMERERAEQSLTEMAEEARMGRAVEGGVVNDMGAEDEMGGSGYVYRDSRASLFENEELAYGNTGKKPTLQRHTAILLMMFMERVVRAKKDVDVTVDFIKDKVFRAKESEKYDFTDRLKNMSDEMRAVDTIMKIHKIGDVYSIGLSKGLRSYDTETYERDKELASRIYKIENKIARTTGGDVRDTDVMEAIEEMETDEVVSRDNLINPTDDFFSGDPWGDELDADDMAEYD